MRRSAVRGAVARGMAWRGRSCVPCAGMVVVEQAGFVPGSVVADLSGSRAMGVAVRVTCRGGRPRRLAWRDPFGGGVIGNTTGSGPVIGGSSPPPRALRDRRLAGAPQVGTATPGVYAVSGVPDMCAIDDQPHHVQAIRVVDASVRDPVAAALVRRTEAELCARYGIPSIGHLQPEDFEPGVGGCFAVAWLGSEPVGCGGIRRLDDTTCELKRLYVDPVGRRRGVARAVLAYLERAAATTGYRELWLETGTEQPEAIALYESAGYHPASPFGEHGHDRRSRYFAIDLVAGP